jgi:hypothetical protein
MPDVERVAIERILRRLESRLPSRLSSHPGPCCRAAKAWFTALVSSSSPRDEPPSWLSVRWRWGPSSWPLHWCEAVRAPRLDCGALAALARSAWEVLGYAALPVQMVERFNAAAGENWRSLWERSSVEVEWVWDDLVYHEAVAILGPRGLLLWDPTDRCWIESRARNGYGSAVAIRVDRPAIPGVSWGDRVAWRSGSLPLGEWQILTPVLHPPPVCLSPAFPLQECGRSDAASVALA